MMPTAPITTHGNQAYLFPDPVRLKSPCPAAELVAVLLLKDRLAPNIGILSLPKEYDHGTKRHHPKSNPNGRIGGCRGVAPP